MPELVIGNDLWRLAAPNMEAVLRVAVVPVGFVRTNDQEAHRNAIASRQRLPRIFLVTAIKIVAMSFVEIRVVGDVPIVFVYPCPIDMLTNFFLGRR